MLSQNRQFLIVACLLLWCGSYPCSVDNALAVPTHPSNLNRQESEERWHKGMSDEAQEVVYRYLFARYKDRWTGIHSYQLLIATGYVTFPEDDASDTVKARLKAEGFPIRMRRGELTKDELSTTVSFGVALADSLDADCLIARASAYFDSRYDPGEERLFVVKRLKGTWTVIEPIVAPAPRKDAVRETVFGYLMKPGTLYKPGGHFPSQLADSSITVFAAVDLSENLFVSEADPQPDLMERLAARYRLRPNSKIPKDGPYIALKVGPMTWVDENRVIVFANASVGLPKNEPSVVPIDKTTALLVERKPGRNQGQWTVASMRVPWTGPGE